LIFLVKNIVGKSQNVAGVVVTLAHMIGGIGSGPFDKHQM